MRTTTITLQKTINLLQITQDEDPQDPRGNDNIGYIDIREHRQYNFPKELSIDWDSDDEETAENFCNELLELEKDFYIFPIDYYEHSWISFSLSGTGHQCQFDTSMSVGIIAIPKVYNGYDIKEWNRSKTKDNPKATTVTVTEPEAIIMAKEELDEYNKYLNGEVYQFILYDNDGNHVDYCGGFYDIDDIKDHLPAEWKDENMDDYLTY